MRVLVLGVGNPLMGDDGFGLALLEHLRQCCDWPAGVTLMDGGTWGMNLLPAIEDADALLILDAIDAGRAPGALVRLDRGQLPRYVAQKLSPHQVDLRDVLALAELRGHLPGKAAAVGIQPERIALGTELSGTAARRLDAAADAARAVLRTWGVEAPRPTEVPI
jgi:hydrogenase maturation protease